MTADELLMLQIQALSELEKASFIETLVDHLSKNKQLHLIQNCFEDPRVDELEDEVWDLEQKVTDLEFDKRVLEDQLQKIKA